MPSGRTHDRITIWSLPIIAGLTYSQTRSSTLTLVVTGGFFLGGLMFGPDLDIDSVQYQRWGWLRWIWIPYQKSLHHRSFLSHGPLIGTALRLLYLGTWIALVAVLGLKASELLWGMQWNWNGMGDAIARSVRQYRIECVAIYIGLELGAMSHSLSDWIGSSYKRFKKQGWRGLFPPQTPPKKLRPRSSGARTIRRSKSVAAKNRPKKIG